MNKTTYIIIVSLLFSWNTFTIKAQTILRTENFDNLTPGISIGMQDTTGFWSVFNDSVGSVHDPIISNDFFVSDSNSMHINKTGALYNLSKKTSGRYQLDLKIYVKKYALGFVGITQSTTDDKIASGIEIYFDYATTSKQEGYFYANNQTFTFDYTSDEWISVKLIIDIDDDFATTYINDKEIAYYKWAGGSTGITDLSSIESILLYSVYINYRHADYFVDDIEFKNVNKIEAPTNLKASLSGTDINLSWNAPTDYEAASYILFKNGVAFDTVYNETSYTDTSLYPSTYTYYLRANTVDNGYSHLSNESTVTLEGGVERRNTLFEIFTGTWCHYCPGAALAADDLISHGDNAAIIEYHTGDDFTNDHGLWRKSKYYDVSSFPTVVVDNGLQLAWGNDTESVYPIYKPIHDNAKVKPALHDITLDVKWLSPLKYELTVNIQEYYKYFNNVRLQVAVTESHIEYEWFGLSELNFVLKKMYPHARGTELDFSTSNEFSKTFTIELDEGAEITNTEIVAFVQDEDTKEVSQTVKMNLSTVGISNDFLKSNRVYPNPTNNYIQINEVNNKKVQAIEIYSMKGLLIDRVENIQAESKISLEHFNNGLYLIKINYSNAEVEFHKIIKN